MMVKTFLMKLLSDFASPEWNMILSNSEKLKLYLCLLGTNGGQLQDQQLKLQESKASAKNH